jgi:hypothetical protein
VNERYVRRVLRAALLAPDIVEAVLEGRQSPQLSVDKLRFGAPLLSAEQRESFGSDSTSLQHPTPTRSLRASVGAEPPNRGAEKLRLKKCTGRGESADERGQSAQIRAKTNAHSEHSP